MKKKKTDSQRRSEAFAKWQAERDAAKVAVSLPAEEWTDSADNEPDEEELWWARMLMEEGDEQC